MLLGPVLQPHWSLLTCAGVSRNQALKFSSHLVAQMYFRKLHLTSPKGVSVREKQEQFKHLVEYTAKI